MKVEYAFQDMKTGKVVYRKYEYGQAPAIGAVARNRYVRLSAAQVSQGAPGGHLPACWPMKSVALRCHPSQRVEMMEACKRAGVPTEYDRRGYPIIRDRSHRAAFMGVHQVADSDAGYGDRAPQYL